LSRTLKLFINLFCSSLIFNYFVLILILLLNPQVHINFEGFFLLSLSLYIFYGPLWFIFAGVIFSVIQFFSEKKYPIGFFNPPTLTYFFSFTSLIISFILYFNYDYYIAFIDGEVKADFIQILLVNLALVITGIVFVFWKKNNKKWIQALFVAVLVFNICYSYIIVVANSTSRGYFQSKVTDVPGKNKDSSPGKFTPRKIRVVLMEGLSLRLVNSLTAEQKLLNFNEIIRKGVSGKIDTFKPNLNLSMRNTALTGLRPSQYPTHSHEKFKFINLNDEFDVRPRYIFFRKSPFIKITSFYNKNDNQFPDMLRFHYETNNRKTIRLIRPRFIETYSVRALNRNNRFVLLFPDLVKNKDEKDEKYDILRKCFFLDDNIKNRAPDLKDTDIYYSIIQLPGLETVGRYFYQYYIPQIFGGISLDDVKIKKYGGLLEKYYEYYDSIIGNLMSTTGDDELLVIMSFYEYEPLPLWRRIMVHLLGEKDIYVYVPLNSKGTILMYEKNALKKGYPLKEISIYDIYPTLLYYSGFQLSTDLQGEVAKEIFTDDFLLNNPIDLDTDNK
jgi:hypothetical protein